MPFTAGSEHAAAAPVKINSDLPVLMVGAFTPATGVAWPYDAVKIRTEIAAALKGKDGNRFHVVLAAPSETQVVLLLKGQIIAYRAGSKFSPFCSRREHATVQWWLVEPNGRKILQHWDVIRQPYSQCMVYRDAQNYKFLSGQLSAPLADKIASDLHHSNLP
jgi:hypothetical protein